MGVFNNDNFPSLFLIDVDLYFFCSSLQEKLDLHKFAWGKYGAKSANEEEIKGKNGKYGICIPFTWGCNINSCSAFKVLFTPPLNSYALKNGFENFFAIA